MITLQKENGMIFEPAKELPVIDEYDVLVVGGGMAGVGARFSKKYFCAGALSVNGEYNSRLE